MKIAVPSTGENIKSMISNTLGRCQFIIIYDTKTKKYSATANPGILVQEGSGIRTVEIILNSGADAVLTEEIGVKAYSVLVKEHIDVHLINSVTYVEEAIKKFLKN